MSDLPQDNFIPLLHATVGFHSEVGLVDDPAFAGLVEGKLTPEGPDLPGRLLVTVVHKGVQVCAGIAPFEVNRLGVRTQPKGRKGGA